MAAIASGKPRGRRLRRGTRTEDYLAALSGDHAPTDNSSSSPRASTSALPGSSSSSSSLASIESPFQVQEYLTMLVADNPHDIERLVQIPRWKKATSSSASNSEDKGKQVVAATAVSASRTTTNGSPSKGDNAEESAQSLVESDSEDDYDHVDRDLWLYEHLRRLAIDLSQPFVLTLQEHCSRETCPEMKAGEWLYLCAAHSTANETECCAIDYITHTLDGATALLNSSRYFPSRLNVPNTSLKHFTSIARRLYRIFAHAWYHHRELFDICEASTSLYERFLALSLEYELVPRELLVVPSQREQQEQETQQEEGAEAIDSGETVNADAKDSAGPTAASSNKDVKAVAETIRRTIMSRQERDNAAEEEMHAQFERRILEKRGIAASSATERASSPSISSTGTAVDVTEGRVSTTSSTSTTTSRTGAGAGRTSGERRLFGAEMGDELDILDADDDEDDEDDDYDSSSDDSSAEEDKRIDKTMPVHAYAATVEPVADAKAEAEVDGEQGAKTGAAQGGDASLNQMQADQTEEMNKTEESETIAEGK